MNRATFEIKQEYKDIINNWYKNEQHRILIISGYAGCGKTTLARSIPGLLKAGSTIFLAPTGKAATVLSGRARTIHSYLYIPVVDPITKKVSFDKKFPEDFEDDLLIVDEISMVNEEMLQDLMDTGIPIIGLGDPAQLPPVQGTNEILHHPDIFLTEVFRNDGGILALATDIRMKNRLTFKYNHVSWNFTGIAKQLNRVDDDAIIICKFNKTRRAINKQYRREVKHFAYILEVGEKLIITRNNRDSGLMNGSIVFIKDILKVKVEALLAQIIVTTPDGYERELLINLDTIMQRDVRPMSDKTIHDVDYAYAITCHKAQGSEYKKVFIINEGRRFDNHQAWFYTAVTRAREEIFIYN
jgi:exodeoxyribonuclease-5